MRKIKGTLGLYGPSRMRVCNRDSDGLRTGSRTSPTNRGTLRPPAIIMQTRHSAEYHFQISRTDVPKILVAIQCWSEANLANHALAAVASP